MAIQTLYRTIQDVKGTNTVRVQIGTEGTMVAQTLLSAHAPEAPVVDDRGRFVGLVSESELLEVIESGRELRSTKVEDIMSRELHFVNQTTPIETALRYIEKNHLLNLPVVEDGYLIKTVSLHDLLRAMVNAGLGLE
ncbi:MAG TPA: CBS domain-containing protein [Nitrospiria bacterium]|jgi:CBS domain-containing protein|nr:CBS domain-containing protein [Nitrospiria bacterium]